MFAIVINKQGYKVEFVTLNEDKTPRFYDLKDDENIIEKDWQIANTLLKPKWNGSEWIEGATDEEIKAWEEAYKPQELPQIKTNQELTEELTNAQIYITELELQNLEMSIQQEMINQRLEALENGR